MSTTITTEDGKKKLLKAMEKWEAKDLHAAITDLIEQVPGRALEVWVAKLLVDKEGNSPTIVGPG